jgi:hypothetical protein
LSRRIKQRMRIRLGTEVSVFMTSLSRTAWIGISASRFGSMSIGTKFSPICRPWPA